MGLYNFLFIVKLKSYAEAMLTVILFSISVYGRIC